MGATRGLGRAIAQRLSSDGYSVHLLARSEPDLKSLAAKLGEGATWQAVDVAVGEELVASLRRAADRHGPIDVLVCNGGGPSPGGLFDLTEDDWSTAWQLTLMSTVRAVREVSPAMIERQQGRILVLGSSGVRIPIPGLLLSNVYRAGVLALVRSLARDFGPHGVTINLVAPGRFDTDRVAELDKRRAGQLDLPIEDVRRQSIAKIPVGRYGDPAELASVVAFLAGAEASYITGQCILVDGGMVVGEL
jgi:3-oxoacyl-[acyl-carrier protein] reductase